MAASLCHHILDLEWTMFVAVKSSRPVACQKAPANFRDIRGSLLDTWTAEMQASYCVDLEAATAYGRNLLAEKYARMDDLIPPQTDDPVIGLIVDVESAWQDEIRCRFPMLYQRCCRSTAGTGDGREFAVYLRSELETYGYETRQLYFLNVKNAERAGRNLGLEALQNLVKRFGYEGLEQAEEQFRASSTAEIPSCS